MGKSKAEAEIVGGKSLRQNLLREIYFRKQGFRNCFERRTTFKIKITSQAAAWKFFEKGVQRGKIFFKKFFPSGRGEAAKLRKLSAKGCGENKSFPHISVFKNRVFKNGNLIELF